jgi:diacylglycerol O-acyltransferase / wax synthase
MRRLNGMDATFLATESSSVLMHGAGLTIVDPSALPGGYDLERFRSVIDARLDRLVPFRQHLVPVPLGLDRPVWIDDPSFDLRAHVRAVAVPRPGTPRQVGELVGWLLSQPMDRDRPLWQMWLIEGLEHGHVGVFGKVHHALLGGTRATAMFELLFDLDLDFGDEPASGDRGDGLAVERPPGVGPTAGHALASLAGTPIRLAGTATSVARAASRIAGFSRSDDWGDVVLPFQAPMVSFNGTLSGSRTCAYSSISLQAVKEVKNALGVTVNDVVLAVCGGALRQYLASRGELPEHSLTASVPVSVQGGPSDQQSVIGTTVSVFGASLGTDIAHPVTRLRRIHASTRAAKGLHRAMGSDTVERLSSLLPPVVNGALLHAYSASGLPSRLAPPFNLIISNLPGPPMTLYSAGAPVVASYILGPLIEGGGVNITVLSYRDAVNVGIVACTDLVPDPWPIADAIPGVMAELQAALAA